MLARREGRCKGAHWKQELAEAFRLPEELLFVLGLSQGSSPMTRVASEHFRFLVPRDYAALMEPGNPNDPLLRQVLPSEEELEHRPCFSPDPVGDRTAMRAPGLLQKYRGRALLLVSSACAIHCRFCFRRHFPYASYPEPRDRANAALAQLAADTEVSEVILSGGDPLILDDLELATLVRDLASIPHLKRLRLHTRLPIVLPSRVTPELCQTLTGGRLQAVIVVHANHAAELGTKARRSLRRLSDAGLTLLNQSVLLRRVNDHPDDLVDLSEALFESAVLPYYLHLLDRVTGAAHFEVTEESAARLMEQLRIRLPGYLVPRLVREEAGAPFKMPVC